MQYYYIASLLPTLEIGHIPSINTFELKEILAINLEKKDRLKVRKLLSEIDLENMRALWAGEPHDLRGNYTREELEGALLHQVWPDGREFPPYLKDFLVKYRDHFQRLTHFSLLRSDFLKESAAETTGFLESYFSWERQLRLVLAGFRAKKMGRDISRELQFEDPYDPLVAQILAQKDSPVYEPPFEFKELKPLFLAYGDIPLELHKAILAYSFAKIQELYGNEIFSIDRILGFMARLRLVEQWLELDMQEGIKMIDTIEEK